MGRKVEIEVRKVTEEHYYPSNEYSLQVLATVHGEDYYSKWTEAYLVRVTKTRTRVVLDVLKFNGKSIVDRVGDALMERHNILEWWFTLSVGDYGYESCNIEIYASGKDIVLMCDDATIEKMLELVVMIVKHVDLLG